jgi:hypothetical protein
MSTIVAAALLVNLMLFIPPQNPVSSETPDTINVIKASWEKQSFRPGWDEAQDPASNGLHDTATTIASPADTVMNSNGTQGAPVLRGPERREPQKRQRDARETEGANVAYGQNDRVNKYVYQIKVLNNGSKAIAAIDWEYQFSTDDIEPARHRFQSFQRIKPGSSSTLTGESRIPPTRVVSASSKSEVTSRIVVHCVLYSDGTASWRPDHSEADCQSIRSRRGSR